MALWLVFTARRKRLGPEVKMHKGLKITVEKDSDATDKPCVFTSDLLKGTLFVKFTRQDEPREVWCLFPSYRRRRHTELWNFDLFLITGGDASFPEERFWGKIETRGAQTSWTIENELLLLWDYDRQMAVEVQPAASQLKHRNEKSGQGITASSETT